MPRSADPIAVIANALSRHGPLPENDLAALASVPAELSCYASHATIGITDSFVTVVEGSVVRYGCVSGAGSAICAPIGFSLAGDIVNLRHALFDFPQPTMARSGCPTVVAKVRLAEFLQLAADHPAIQRALRKELACQEIILQQWTLNIGQRRARARIAALLLELEARSARAGLVQDGTFQLPATQDVLASALGLSLVHFSKSLASLRDENLVYTAGRSVNLLRPEALRRLTHFDPIYLETEAVIPRLPTLVSSLAEVAA